MNPVGLIIVLLTTAVASALFTYLVRGFMRRYRILDVPAGGRKLHGQPVAYEGGLAIFGALLVGVLAMALLQPRFLFDLHQIRGLVFGATLATALGVADDLLDLRPTWKLVVQLEIGAIMFLFGFRIERITNPFGGDLVFWHATSLLGTMLWYALLMNGINMVDGLDGLAAGIVGVSAITLCAIALDLNQPLAVALSLVVVGACAGFLPFNFNPASIFMGDAGSLLLGFLLASITLLSSSKAPAVLALLIPVLAVGLPLFETAFAFLRRAARGRNPFKADRRHLHHRLLSLGLSERRTVLIFYYVTAFLGIIAYMLQRLPAAATLVLVVLLAIGALLIIENMRFLERRFAHQRPLEDTEER